MYLFLRLWDFSLSSVSQAIAELNVCLNTHEIQQNRTTQLIIPERAYTLHTHTHMLVLFFKKTFDYYSDLKS
jgi:hypothetical protein